MSNEKIKKSFLNLSKALKSLEEALALPIVVPRDTAGVIQNFEFVYELTWKTLKVILEKEKVEANFPREVLEKAFQFNLLGGNDNWVEIMKGRNISSHTYDSSLAEELYKKIKSTYMIEFKSTFAKIEAYVQTQI